MATTPKLARFAGGAGSGGRPRRRGRVRGRLLAVTDALDQALAAVDTWGIANVAAAVVPATGEVHVHGDTERRFRVASVGKVVAGYALMIGVEEGAVELDEPAGP